MIFLSLARSRLIYNRERSVRFGKLKERNLTKSKIAEACNFLVRANFVTNRILFLLVKKFVRAPDVHRASAAIALRRETLPKNLNSEL